MLGCAGVMGAATPMVDDHAQTAQQNVSMSKGLSWAEQVDSEELIEGFSTRVQRVGGAEVSEQAN